MNTWEKTEKTLAALKKAGAEIVGEEIKPTFKGGVARERVVAEYKRKERWIHYKQKRWPEW